MTKTLMIIGAGAEQVPAYELAKARGFKVIGTDLNPNAPGLKIADYALYVSTKDAQSTANAAEQFNKLQKIDGVMTIANDVPFTVAIVSEELRGNVRPTVQTSGDAWKRALYSASSAGVVRECAPCHQRRIS